MESSRPRYASRCAICGKPARIDVGTVSYCLDCYNRISDYLTEVDSPTNDTYGFLALDPHGHAVEFAVERCAFGFTSVWTAVEQVPEDDPRRELGYVGRSVSIAADARVMSQEEALDALMVKTQRLTGHASMRVVRDGSSQTGKSLTNDEGYALFANETGMAHIESDGDGRVSFVVDGRRLTAEQFASLLECFEGNDIYWQMLDVSDEPPAGL